MKTLINEIKGKKWTNEIPAQIFHIRNESRDHYEIVLSWLEEFINMNPNYFSTFLIIFNNYMDNFGNELEQYVSVQDIVQKDDSLAQSTLYQHVQWLSEKGYISTSYFMDKEDKRVKMRIKPSDDGLKLMFAPFLSFIENDHTIKNQVVEGDVNGIIDIPHSLIEKGTSRKSSDE